MPRMLLFSLTAISLSVFPAPAPAQTRTEHWNRCVNFLLPDDTDQGNESPEQALASCSWLLQSGALSDEEKTLTYASRGAVFLAKKDFNAARVDLTSAIDLGVFNDADRKAGAYYNRARAYERLERRSEALADVDRAIEVAPTAARYEGRGNLRDVMGDAAGALRDWDMAMVLRPARPIARYCEKQLADGAAMAAAANYSQAVRALSEALRCPAVVNRALLARATAHRFDGSPSRALDDLDKLIAGGVRTPGVLIERALTLETLSRPDDALGDLNAALALDARNARALALRAAAHRTRQNHDLALADADASLAIDPRNGGAHLERGIVLLTRRRTADAVRSLSAALTGGAPAGEALQYRALGHLLLGDDASAASDLEALRKTNPSGWRFFFGTAVLKERQGDSAGAAAARTSARVQPGYAPDEIAALGFAPSVLELWPSCEAAPLIFYEVESPRALQACTALIESRGLTVKDLARAFMFRGHAHVGLGDEAKAIEDLSRAIAAAPSFGDAYYWRGWVHWRGRQFAQAIADQSRAIELNVRTDAARLERGRSYLHTKQHALAAADFSALVMKADSVEALLLRGLARQMAGDWKGADTDFLAATTRRPQFALYAWTYYAGTEPSAPPGTRPGASRDAADNWKRCGVYRPADLDACGALIASGTESADRQKIIREVRGAALARTGQHAAAAADYTWLLEQNEKDVSHRFERALAYFNSGDLKSAMFDLDLLTQMTGTSGGAHVFFARGVIRQRLGDSAGAARDVAEALKRDSTIEKYMATRGITR